jgi:hypothetical protein
MVGDPQLTYASRRDGNQTVISIRGFADSVCGTEKQPAL